MHFIIASHRFCVHSTSTSILLPLVEVHVEWTQNQWLVTMYVYLYMYTVVRVTTQIPLLLLKNFFNLKIHNYTEYMYAAQMLNFFLLYTCKLYPH